MNKSKYIIFEFLVYTFRNILTVCHKIKSPNHMLHIYTLQVSITEQKRNITEKVRHLNVKKVQCNALWKYCSHLFTVGTVQSGVFPNLNVNTHVCGAKLGEDAKESNTILHL